MAVSLISGFRHALTAWVDLARRGAALVVLAALAASVALSYYTAGNLGMNTSTEDMLSEDLPFRQRAREFDRAFPQLSGNLLLVIDGADADQAEDAADALAARLAVMDDLLADVHQPGGDPFFVDNGLLYLDADELDRLADRLADAQPLLTDLARDPSMRGLFAVLGEAVDAIVDGEDVPSGLAGVLDRVSDTVEAQGRGDNARLSWQELIRDQEGTVEERRRYILARPKPDFNSLQPAAHAIAAVREAAAELGFGREGGPRLRLTGSAALDHEELDSVKDSAGVAGVISIALVAVLLLWGLGSLRLVAAALLTLLAGLAWTAAFAAFAIGHLNLISVAFAVLFIGLGVDFAIHFCLRYREEIDAGQDGAEALRRAAAGVGDALTLCAVAAAIGFLSFLPTAFVGVSELGLISSAGMFIALFASLTLLPALLALMPMRPRNPGRSGEARSRARDLVARRARVITRGAAVLGVAALAALPFARFDFDPFNLKDPSTESVQTYVDLVRESDRAPYTIEILADDLDQAAALAPRLEALDEVDEALTLHDFVPGNQDEKLFIIEDMTLFLSPLLRVDGQVPPPDEAGLRAALAELRAKLESLIAADAASDEELAAATRRLALALEGFAAAAEGGGERLLELQNALVGSLPKRLGELKRSLGARPITLESLPESVTSRRLAADGRARVEVYPEEDIRDQRALRRFVAAVRSVAPDATDSPVIILEAGNAVVAAFQQATVTALVLISLLLLALLRSVRDSALVLAPLLLAGLLTVATTVLLGIPFNFANVIVLPLLLGLGVASGIHLMMRHRSEARGDALLTTSTPRAVLFSALTTVGSFGTLAISSHRGTASMGLLLVIAILYTLLCALVVLPAMLSLRAPKDGARPA